MKIRLILLLLLCIEVKVFCINFYGDTGYFFLSGVNILKNMGFAINYLPIESEEFKIDIYTSSFIKSFKNGFQCSFTSSLINFSSNQYLGYESPPQNLRDINFLVGVKYIFHYNPEKLNLKSHVCYGIGILFPVKTLKFKEPVRNVLNVMQQGLAEKAFKPSPYIVYGANNKNSQLGLYVKFTEGLGIGGGYIKKEKKFHFSIEGMSSLYRVKDVKLDKRIYAIGIKFFPKRNFSINLSYNIMKIGFEGKDFEKFVTKFTFPQIGVNFFF